MAQVVEHLPNKYETLVLSTTITKKEKQNKKKPSQVPMVHTCNPFHLGS
jgi:hypothetical protein